jgi:hypothetical protein
MLLSSLNILDKDIYNIILINSFDEGYKSAAEAYNKTIEQREHEIGDILIFCHQDIAFDNVTFLQNIISELTENPNQIIGFAGIDTHGSVLSNLQYQENKQFITRNQIKAKEKVVTIDECCFATSKTVYQKLKFDEYVCNHWHLYAVELCCNARRNEISSYVMPDIIYHKKNNNGGMYTDKHFLKSMWRLIKKFKKDFDYIYAPCYICSTNRFIAVAKILRTSIRNLLQ